jgi:hypothetical protein
VPETVAGVATEGAVVVAVTAGLATAETETGDGDGDGAKATVGDAVTATIWVTLVLILSLKYASNASASEAAKAAGLLTGGAGSGGGAVGTVEAPLPALDPPPHPVKRSSHSVAPYLVKTWGEKELRLVREEAESIASMASLKKW